MTNFLPVTKKDMENRGWQQVDFVIVTGDAYVDHPSFGTALISRIPYFFSLQEGFDFFLKSIQIIDTGGPRGRSPRWSAARSREQIGRAHV